MHNLCVCGPQVTVRVTSALIVRILDHSLVKSRSDLQQALREREEHRKLQVRARRTVIRLYCHCAITVLLLYFYCTASGRSTASCRSEPAAL